MPQIWLSYEELAEFTQRTPAAAREAAIQWGWSRRQCRDGVSRVKLPSSVATAYIAQSYGGCAPMSADELVAMLRISYAGKNSGPIAA